MFSVFYTNDNQEKAEILNSYFASVYLVVRSEALPELEDRNYAEPVTNIDINRTKISKAIDKLKHQILRAQTNSPNTYKRM